MTDIAMVRMLEERDAEIERLRKVLAIEGLSCKVAADIERQQKEIERLTAECREHQGRIVEHVAEIERLTDVINTLRELREYDRTYKIAMLNWLNTHHPHIAIAWERALRA